MQIRISDDGIPIFRQIVDQLRHRILAGTLPPGSELPPIRRLATDLAVNPNTIARAYRELETEELIEKRRTVGTFVRDDVQTQSITRRLKKLHPSIDDLLAAAAGLNITPDEICELILSRSNKVKK